MDGHAGALLLCLRYKMNRSTMKKLLPFVFAMLAMPAFSQVGFNGLNYQAVVRDANGDPLPNQMVSVYIELYNGVGGGFVSYAEEHSVSTNDQGLITLVIGEGVPVSTMNYADVDWTMDTPWSMEVMMDVAGGTNYALMGSTQLRAVPYAEHAHTADSLTSGLHWEVAGTVLSNTHGGPVRITGDGQVDGNVNVNGYLSLGGALLWPDWDIDAQADKLVVNEGGVGPRLTILDGGNVGVGTTTPDTTLHVVGAFKLEDGSQGAGKVLTSDANGLAVWQPPTGGGGHWTANGNDIHNTNSGKVGIGTTTPGPPLHVYNTVQGSTVRVENSTSTGTINVRTPGCDMYYGVLGNKGYIMNASNTDLAIGTNGLTRMTVTSAGDVGLGTTTPGAELDIFSPDNLARIIMKNPASTNGANFRLNGLELSILNRDAGPLFFATSNLERMRITPSGDVGIGTTAPAHKLDVRGNMRLGNGSEFEQDIHFWSGNGSWQVGTNDAGNGALNNQFYIYDDAVGQYRLTVQRSTGYVGIGTTTPQSALAVNGKITAKEVEVTLAGFPDYVFEPDYDLMTLEEVEAYIQEHGHLPHVPSACEVEENGLGLGEMNKILLEKVEELTLHLIEKEAELKQLRADVDALLGR